MTAIKKDIREGDKNRIVITRENQEYIRGLRDGGIYYAAELYDMLAVCPEVTVRFDVR